MPKVSVVMSVFNGEPYLSQAIESILSQTFDDFEFIIVDDGSTDSSPMILETFAKKDVRIRLLRNDSKSGLIASLNKAFQAAQGEYIARQDADDVSLPGRFEAQVNFLDQHPEAGVVGTWIVNVEDDGERSISQRPLSDALIRWYLLFESSIAHASVMMRHRLLDQSGPYRAEMLHAEDYDLWVRLSERTQLANLPSPLYVRRRHKNRVSVKYRETQVRTGIMVMANSIEKLLGKEVRHTVIKGLNDVYGGGFLENKGDLLIIGEFIIELYRTYLAKNVLDADEQTEVAQSSAKTLTHIGLKHIRRSPREALYVLRKAIQLGRWIPWNIYMAEALKCLKA